jgi:hypothetical protein
MRLLKQKEKEEEEGFAYGFAYIFAIVNEPLTDKSVRTEICC